MRTVETIEGLYYKDPYIVYLSEIEVDYAGAVYESGYKVLNTGTDVVEFMSPSLPDCISLATQSAAALVFFTAAENEDVETDGLEEDVIH